MKKRKRRLRTGHLFAIEVIGFMRSKDVKSAQRRLITLSKFLEKNGYVEHVIGTHARRLES